MRMITLTAKVVFLAGSIQHGSHSSVFPAGIHGKSLCRDEFWPLSMSSLVAVYGSVSSDPQGLKGLSRSVVCLLLASGTRPQGHPRELGPGSDHLAFFDS